MAAQGELMVVIGLVFAVISLPSLISAWSDGRRKTGPLMTLALGIGLFFLGSSQIQGGVGLEDIDDIVFRVAGRLLS